MRELDLSWIVRDPDLQVRGGLSQETVVQFAEDMLAGIAFPPVVVYHDGEHYWLSQGFHRCAAAEMAGWETIPAEVREGTRDDAILDSAGSNKEGDTAIQRRTNAQKRRAVVMVLKVQKDWEEPWSDRRIAEHVGVADVTVGRARSNLNNVGVDTRRRVGRDNKSRPSSNTRKPKPDPEPGEAKPSAELRFNGTNEQVDWARWTWNPVTGCEHNCVYCYARDIANRFYPEKFAPTFRPERLEAPRNTNVPDLAETAPTSVERMAWRNVFVCSMADLFGRWVPDDWIRAVFDSCRRSPDWNYLFLTKFPQRYVELDLPETAWVGTSVDEQRRVPHAEKAFAKLDAKVKWLSVEPMREPIVFDDMSMFHWVVIGGQSRSSGDIERHPEPRWVVKLIDRAWDAGCKVYLKPNTFADARWTNVKEYPY